MLKTILGTVAVLLFIVSIDAGSHLTAEEAKSEMIAAGISAKTVDGLISIADKYKSQFEKAKTDREAGQAAFDAFHKEAAAYIKTQSESDQKAYNAFIEKKQAAYRGFKTQD